MAYIPHTMRHVIDLQSGHNICRESNVADHMQFDLASLNKALVTAPLTIAMLKKAGYFLPIS